MFVQNFVMRKIVTKWCVENQIRINGGKIVLCWTAEKKNVCFRSGLKTVRQSWESKKLIMKKNHSTSKISNSPSLGSLIPSLKPQGIQTVIITY